MVNRGTITELRTRRAAEPAAGQGRDRVQRDVPDPSRREHRIPVDAGWRIIHFTLYSRAYCHLCDDMARALADLQRELPAVQHFSVEVIDVDADPALVERYDELVPVLSHQGREVCHYHLDRDAVLAIVGRSADDPCGVR